MKKQLLSPRCSHKSSISKLSKKLSTVRAENSYLRQELSSINKERARCHQKSKEFNRMIVENGKKVSYLEAELKSARGSNLKRRASKQSMSGKLRKMVDLIHRDETLSLYFSQHFESSGSALPRSECFVNFITEVLQNGKFKPVRGAYSMAHTIESYRHMNNYSNGSDAESNHCSRLDQLHQEIKENLTRTRQVLSNSYASSPINHTRSNR